MMATETRTSRLAFFGRLADALTRQPLVPQDMTVSLEGSSREALLKQDGHFALADLAPMVANYLIHIGGPVYHERVVAKALPTLDPVQLTFPGEDELFVAIDTVTPGRVTFETIPFVAPIATGSAVLGEAGFTATLTDSVEGQQVNFAMLSSVAGLASGQLLRIVRSPNLILRPGPYYAFPADMTVLALKVVENAPGEAPIGAASIALTQVNGAGGSVVNVGGLPLNRFDLGGAPSSFLVLGADDVTTTTNARGDAVFAFPGSKPITALQVTVTQVGYQTAVASIPITAQTRGSQKISLTRA